MSQEGYIIAGIVLGLVFTELTGMSPGGIIVPGYLAIFLFQPLGIALTGIAAVGAMFGTRLVSRLFFLFGRRRYAVCLLFGILLKLGVERLSTGLPILNSVTNVRLIGWLIPGIIANDMYKQGIPRTLIAAGTVTALVFLAAQGFSH